MIIRDMIEVEMGRDHGVDGIGIDIAFEERVDDGPRIESVDGSFPRGPLVTADKLEGGKVLKRANALE